MACKIVYNGNNQPIGVEENNSLFQQILSIPHIKDFKEALDIFKQTYSPKVLYSVVGERGAYNVEQYQQKLNEAKELDKKGANINEIEEKTGWFKNSQGQWKYFSNEFIDQFKLKEEAFNSINTEQNLEDVIQDNIIFEAYPESKKVKVIFYDKTYENIPKEAKAANGFLREQEGEFTIYANVDNVDGKSMDRIIGHELNHYVQRVEGFSTGAGTMSILMYAMNITGASNVKPNNLLEYFNDFNTDSLSSDNKKIIEEAKIAYNNFTKKDRVKLNAQIYRVQGEIDSRAVELAMELKDRYRVNNLSYKQLLDEVMNRDGINPSEVIDLYFNGEVYDKPTLEYNSFSSFAEALKESGGEDIKIGIKGSKILVTVSGNTNVNTQVGLTNNLIKSGLLSGESYLNSYGNKVLKVEGNSEIKKAINSDIALSSARKYSGVRGVRASNNGDIIFNTNLNARQITATKKDGSTVYLLPSEIQDKTFKELDRQYEDALSIVALRELKENTSVFGEPIKELEIIPEDELQVKLLGVLRSLGVKTTTITDYLEKYSAKNGVPPTAQALADLTNDIVAFKDGVAQTDDLLEETCHFIIASTPQEQKEDLKRNIHKSPEWVEFQQSYRNIYSQTYSGEELESAVREEIIGKALKNAIKNRFQASESATTTEKSILNKLLEFFKSFFSRVEAYFTNDAQSKLDEYTNAVYTNLMNDSLSDMLSSKDRGNFVLYSMQGSQLQNVKQIYKKETDLLDRLYQQQTVLDRKYKSPESRNELQRAKREIESILTAEEKIDTTNKNVGISEKDRKEYEAIERAVIETSRTKALASLSMVANSQIKYLQKAAEKNKREEHTFSHEERTIYQNFKTKLEPLLNSVRANLDTKNAQQKEIINTIEQTQTAFKNLSASILGTNDVVIKKLVDNIIAKNNMSGEYEAKYRQDLTNILTVAQKDSDFLFAHIGSMVNAQNAYLNLAGDVVERMVIESNTQANRSLKTFMAKAKVIGFPLEKLNILSKNGYILHEKDPKKVEAIDFKDKVLSYNEIKYAFDESKYYDVKDLKELEQLLKDKDFKEFTSTYESNLSAKRSKRRESFYTEGRLSEIDNFYVEIGGDKISKKDLPLEAVALDKSFRAKIGQIKLNNGGENTEDDIVDIQHIKKQALKSSNIRDSEGKLKPGLYEVYDEKLGKEVVKIDVSHRYSSKSEKIDSETAYGFQMINLINQSFYKYSEKVSNYNALKGTNLSIEDFRNIENTLSSQDASAIEVSDKEMPIKFLEALRALPTEQERLKYLQLNAYIGFPKSFWDNLNENATLTDRINSLKEDSPELSEELDELMEDIKSKQSVLNQILKANKLVNQPSETDTSENGISELEKNKVKDLVSLLELDYSKVNSYFKEEDKADFSGDVRTNESYKKDILDELGSNPSLEDRIKFIKKHTSVKNSDSIEKAIRALNGLKSGSISVSSIRKSLQEVFTEDMSNRELEESLIKYAEKKLLPYYKRTEPEGYSEALEKVKSGKITVEQFIANDSIEVSPSYAFYDNKEGINPKFLTNREAGREQYTEEYLDSVRDEEYYTRYGIGANGKATKNTKEFEMREALLEFQDRSIEMLNLTGSHDRYLLPQHRKSAIERLTATGVSDIKETIKDFVTKREDDEETGQDITGGIAKVGSSLLTIPRYGTTKLKDLSDVSENLLASYAWFGAQAAIHKARTENISDMLVLEDSILSSDFVGKEAEATNTYKMLKSFLDSNFYGVKETFDYETTILGKEVNLGKLAKTFNGWVRFSNLAGVTIPITSLLQGTTQKFIESKVGEIINPVAHAEAMKTFRKYASESAREIGGFESTTFLNVLGESFGAYNATERFQNSSYGRGTRTALELNHGTHALGNFPVIMPAMLSVLKDYRYYGGKVVSYNQFKRLNSGNSKAINETNWKQLPLFFDDIAVEDGAQTYKKESILKKLEASGAAPMTDDEYNKFEKGMHESLYARVISVMSDIDSTIPEHEKSIWHRDARMNFLLMHKNWFILAYQKKFKKEHYNRSRDMREEGSWRTTFNFLESLVLNPKDIVKTTKEAWGDELKQRNLKRTLMELAVGNALAIAVTLLANYYDDDDEMPYSAALAEYFMLRVASEQVSSTIALPNQAASVVKDPIIAAQKFTDLFSIFTVFNGDIVKSGAYAGESERFKYLAKNLPYGKEYKRFQNPEDASKSYRFYNQDSLDWAWLASIFDQEK